MSKTAFALSLLSATLLAAPVPAQDWAVEIYGGGVFERHEDTGPTSRRLDGGTAFGAGIYERNLIAGAEIGFDIMRTRSDYAGSSTGDLKSLSLMLNARLPFQVVPGTTAYVSAGLGAIGIDYKGGGTGTSGNDTVPGG